MGLFDSINFGDLQRMVYPIISGLGGPNMEELVAGKAETLHVAAESLSAVAGILDMAAEAAEDGIIDNSEIDAIVAAASDLPEAYEAMRVALLGVPGIDD